MRSYNLTKNASHGETHLRQILHRWAVLYSIVHDENKGSFRRRLAKPLHRIFRASPHSRGGASYAVTHSRRKYHNTCMRFVARCLAIAASRRWPCSLRPPAVKPPFTGDSPCVPAARLRAYRMYLIALFSCIASHFRLAGMRPDGCGALQPNGKLESKIIWRFSKLKTGDGVE